MKRKEFVRRLSALLVTASMIMTSASPAFAEGPAQTEEVWQPVIETAEEETVDESDSLQLDNLMNLLMDEVSGNNAENDTETEAKIEIIEETTTNAADAADPELVATDVNSNEKTFELAYKNYTLSSGSLSIGVWSAEGGQDDLVWYNMTLKDGAYRCTVKVSDHKTLGTYFAHLYHKASNGTMTYLCGTIFQVHAPECQAVEVMNNQDAGTAKILIRGLSCPSGISKVKVPIWVKADKSDLKNYTPVKNADGDYEVTFDIANHGYTYGVYTIDVYATDGNGIESKLHETTTTMNRGDANLLLDGDENGYTIKVRNFRTTGVKEVRFAIWTTENGMDDLEWYTKNLSSTGAASLKWKPSEDGEYNIYCYLVTNEDRLMFKKSLTKEFAIPAAETMTAEADEKDGSFRITVADLKHADVISRIRIPVWSDDQQKDLVWYDAEKQADGSYVAEGNILNHKLHLGTYQAKAYAIDVNGVETDLNLSDSFSFSGEPGTVKAVISEDEKTVKVTAEGIQMPMAAEKIAFAVWSEADGKDDLIWYQGELKSGQASATVNLVDHKTAGTYQVKAYAEAADGKRAYLSATSFKINVAATAAVTYTDRDERNATFKANVTLSDVEGLVTGVNAEVWCDTQDGDVYTYAASEGEDGTWSFTVDIKNHKNQAGTYYVNVYPVFSNGLILKAAESSYSFDVKDYVMVVEKGNGTRTAILRNPSKNYSEISFPTWSEKNGQDDLVWYKGSKQSDGSWQATISSSKHKDSGSFQVHCYADGTFVGSTTFTFTAEEMSTLGDKKVQQYVDAILAVTGRDLRKVFNWIVANINYQTMAIPMAYPEGYTRQQYYMVYGYENRKGNCFCYAALFYWCAIELGYDCKLIEGRYLRRTGAHDPHGWVEVYVNGNTYVCDPMITWQQASLDSYMRPYGATGLVLYPDEPAY